MSDTTKESAGFAGAQISNNAPEQTDNLALIILITCVATLGGFLFGFDSGVINGTVDGLQAAFQSNSIGTGFNVASMLLGCAAGAFAAGNLADRFGRKNVLLIAALLFIISAWGSGIANDSVAFVFFRIIGGLAVGAASIIAPAYICEIAPTKIRGRLASVQQVAIILGLFCAFLSNYYIAQIAGSSESPLWLGYEAWRWMFWVELLPAILFFVGLFLVPESPRFLALKGDKEAGLKTLQTLYGQCGATQAWNKIQQSVRQDSNVSTLSDLRDSASNKLKPIVWVGIGLAVLQQLVGINVIFYYGAILWQAVGFSEADALLINVISGGVSILACLITLYFIDKVGRRPFLLVGSLGMSFSLIGLVIAFANGSLDAHGNLQLGEWGVMALLQANIYVFFFNISWGPVMWVMLGEMFPNQIRGAALAVAGLAQWGANFVVTLSFPLLLAAIGLTSTYALYGLFSILSIFFVLGLVQETKGVDLENM